MKRWIALALVLMMALSLAACGGKGDAETSANADAQTEQPADAATPDDSAAVPDDAAAPDDSAAAPDDAATPDDSAPAPDDAAAPDDSAALSGETAPDDSTQTANPFTDYANHADAETAAGFAFNVPEQIGGYDTVSYRVAEDLSLFEVIYANDHADLTARKAPGGWNISGDYNEKTVEVVDTIAGLEVSYWGDDTGVFLAMWSDNGYSYSLGASESVDRAEFLGIVETIIDLNAA